MTSYSVLSLQVCSETLIGNDQIRGVSGGQRKRVTTGELLVSPKKTLFLDEISTGLDSATTFQIMRTLRHFAHLRQATMLIALLQPTPETYHLFDDIMLLSGCAAWALCLHTLQSLHTYDCIGRFIHVNGCTYDPRDIPPG